jgi:hypothetical protein
MEKDRMIEDIKDLLQTIIAPQLEGIKGDIRALDTKIGALDSKTDFKFDLLEARIGAVDTKVDSFRREVLAEVHRVESTLSSEFVRLEEKVDLRLGSMNEKIDLFRREMLAEIKAASK